MKKSLLLILLILILLLTGCHKQPIADRKGEMLTLDQKELDVGFYVMNEDNSFTPLMSGVYGYQGQSLTSSPERYLWYTHSQYDLTSLIPELTNNKTLVAVFDKTVSIPENIFFEKYKPRGSTLGLKFFISEIDGSVYFSTSTKNILPTSQAGQGVRGMSLPSEVKLYEFNESPAIPKNIIDKDLNMFMGLTEDGLYQIGFFEGTVYYSKGVHADTYIYQSEEMYVLKNPYQISKNGYFTLKMPSLAKEGYYMLNGYGLFYYKP